MESALHTSPHAEALAFLYGRIDYERTTAPPAGLEGLRLRRMRDLLHRLGDPHSRLQIVHLAGTKGKGSTASLISSALTSAGNRVGLYSSPHLDRLEERMCIDGSPCTASELVGLIEQVRPAVLAMDAANEGDEIGPTFFEITTALAMLHFWQKSVDFAVLEVGMGGRLDSTNVCRPLLSVITNISLDHTRQLGNTLAVIAREKAGIVKPGIPVVSGVVTPEPRAVIREIAAERGAPLCEMERDFHFQYRPPDCSDGGDAGLGRFDFADRAVEYTDIELQMLGRHQAANAAVALAALHKLREQGIAVPEAAIRDGMRTVNLPARIEIVGHRPYIILDVAHNVASIEALIETLRPLHVPGERVLIFSATREKDIAGMLVRLIPEFDDIILTRYVKNPRSRPPDELASLARRLASEIRQATPTTFHVAETPAAAWDLFRSGAAEEDLLCATGSFFLAAELRAAFVSG